MAAALRLSIPFALTVLGRTPATGIDALVHVDLAYFSRDFRVCRPAAQIGAKWGLSEKSVRASLRTLERMGLIRRLGRIGPRRATVYALSPLRGPHERE